MRNFAIACMSGSFKGAFVHGVLSAFEELGMRAHAYAACSSATLPAAFTAIGEHSSVDLDIWRKTAEARQKAGSSMSDVVQPDRNLKEV